jgi:membrane associated rhomboid family serine protease
MRKIVPLFLAALAAVTLFPDYAQAYIGPGVGAGAIAAVVGVLGSIFLALVAVVYYPVKRMMKRRKASAPAKPAE